MTAGLRGWAGRARWPAALVVAALGHGGLAWAAWSRTPPSPAEETAATVMMIELAPTPSAPNARVEDLAPAAQAAEESPAPAPVEIRASEAAEESREPPPKIDPSPLASVPPPPDTPLPTAQAEAEAPPPPTAPREAAVVAPRAPSQPARKKPTRAAAASRPVAAAPAAVDRSSVAAASASNLSTSRAELLLSWKGSLLAHINRFKRYPPEARGAGAASVTFTISEAGQVIAARLVASSGDSALDSEAVNLLRRASPVPPPPERRTLTLNLPIRFNRQ